MSLTKCIRKAGKLLSAEDRAAILSKAAEHREAGMSANDAGRAAVRAHMDVLEAQHKALKGDVPATPEASNGAGSRAENGSQQAAPLTLDQALAQKIAAEQPDLQVTLPGSDERLTVADAMQRIAEEQKQDAQWADLVKVATECFLSA